MGGWWKAVDGGILVGCDLAFGANLHEEARLKTGPNGRISILE